MTNVQVPQMYLDFCENPLRTKKDAIADYQRLIAHPSVKGIAFHQPHVMMIQTDTLIVEYFGEEIVIGEFIIFLIRKRDDEGYWRTGFYFSNITRPIIIEYYMERNSLSDRSPLLLVRNNETSQTEEELDEELYIVAYHHPHIISQEGVADIEERYVGELCIAQGGQIVRQALRMGKIADTFAKIWIILRTVDSGEPFKKVQEWQDWEKKHA